MALQHSPAGKWRNNIKFHFSEESRLFSSQVTQSLLLARLFTAKFELFTHQITKAMILARFRAPQASRTRRRKVKGEILVLRSRIGSDTSLSVFCCRLRSPWKPKGRSVACTLAGALPSPVHSLIPASRETELQHRGAVQ